MATTLKTKIGHMPCLCCSEKIPVKEAENGTLNLSCMECDFTGYVKRGTTAHAKIRARIVPVIDSRPAAVSAPGAKTPIAATLAASPVSKRNTIFG